MQVTQSVSIAASKSQVWAAISDLDNAKVMISGIADLEVLERPESGLVGLKWRETRVMWGKEATEVMWITEAQENQYYCTRAESHGSVYATRLSLQEVNQSTELTMAFTAQAETLMAKVLSFIMGPMIRKSLATALSQDLNDIKAFVESQ